MGMMALDAEPFGQFMFGKTGMFDDLDLRELGRPGRQGAVTAEAERRGPIDRHRRLVCPVPGDVLREWRMAILTLDRLVWSLLVPCGDVRMAGRAIPTGGKADRQSFLLAQIVRPIKSELPKRFWDQKGTDDEEEEDRPDEERGNAIVVFGVFHRRCHRDSFVLWWGRWQRLSRRERAEKCGNRTAQESLGIAWTDLGRTDPTDEPPEGGKPLSQWLFMHVQA